LQQYGPGFIIDDFEKADKPLLEAHKAEFRKLLSAPLEEDDSYRKTS
jgi:hypothetical protein